MGQMVLDVVKLASEALAGKLLGEELRECRPSRPAATGSRRMTRSVHMQVFQIREDHPR
jgi:hypothetical protein